ncbi:hypothetical protein [Mycobacterium tuberculosis]|uniref:hypothetical protein n=1 Tax=Mycobacterium tuberculosis TaxID=1773 RepID=UPI001F243C5F|nr:hypothetical protein [Mycobacterium tuberculosis]
MRLIKSGELAAERIGNRHRLCSTTCWPTGRPAGSASTTRLPRAQWTSTPTRIPR